MKRALATALATVAVVAPAAQDAAPRYVLVTGPGLAKPVLLADWGDKMRWLLAVANAPRAAAPARGSVRYGLALFWGVPAQPVPTRPRDAGQHGWFYPATGARPAVVDLQADNVGEPRRAPAALLRTLRLHHVPTRVP
jgi:hypothetical protein